MASETIATMGDLVRRAAADVAASTAGGTVGPVVTALMATAAAVTQNPEFAMLSVPTGALADALTEQGLRLVSRTLLNSADRVSRFAEAIADESGQQAEDFIDEYVVDATQREFLGISVEAATTARSDWKIRLLARAFVRGIKDGDRIDETEMFIKSTRKLEPPHARALAAVIRMADSNNHRSVTAELVRQADQGVGLAAALLWRELRDQGLLAECAVNDEHSPIEPIAATRELYEHPGFWPTDLGRAIAGWLTALDISAEEHLADRVNAIPRNRTPASGGQDLRPYNPD